MKKHVIAAAVATAFSAPAFAQNVTLYGTLDAGIAALSGVGAVSTSETVFLDGTIASSVWGMRGTEDLGGGLRAVFQLESDIQTNNGGMNQNGLFRRAAFVGVSGGFGELTLGLRLNPLIATNGALMPVAGNTVSTLTATALSYSDFYTKNAITWTSPNLNGLVLQGQYGTANTTSTTQTGGSVTAGSASFTSGGLTLRGAMQMRKENGTTSGAATGLPGAADTHGTAQTIHFNSDAYVIGASYATGPWVFAVANIKNKEASAIGGAKFERTANQIGVGYQLSPAVRLGASYTTAEGSTLSNMQARYTLSKRTTAYLNYGVSDNATNTTGTKQVSFLPVAANTGNSPANIISGMQAGIAGRESSAVGVGIIHSF